MYRMLSRPLGTAGTLYRGCSHVPLSGSRRRHDERHFLPVTELHNCLLGSTKRPRDKMILTGFPGPPYDTFVPQCIHADQTR